MRARDWFRGRGWKLKTPNGTIEHTPPKKWVKGDFAMWYSDYAGCWFCTLEGRQVGFGKNPSEAWERGRDWLHNALVKQSKVVFNLIGVLLGGITDKDLPIPGKKMAPKNKEEEWLYSEGWNPIVRDRKSWFHPHYPEIRLMQSGREWNLMKAGHYTKSPESPERWGFLSRNPHPKEAQFYGISSLHYYLRREIADYDIARARLEQWISNDSK